MVLVAGHCRRDHDLQAYAGTPHQLKCGQVSVIDLASTPPYVMGGCPPYRPPPLFVFGNRFTADRTRLDPHRECRPLTGNSFAKDLKFPTMLVDNLLRDGKSESCALRFGFERCLTPEESVK